MIKSLMHFNDDILDCCNVLWNTSIEHSYGTGKFGKAINVVSGTVLTCTDNNVFNFQSSDFTIECWVKLSSTGTLFDTRPNFYSNPVFAVLVNSSNILVRVTFSNSGYSEFTLNTSIVDDQWHHLVFVRYGNDFSAYIDGTYISSIVVSGDFKLLDTSGFEFRIGGNSTANAVTGFIDEFCVTNSARYTSNFIPPSIPYKLYSVVVVDDEDHAWGRSYDTGGITSFNKLSDNWSAETVQNKLNIFDSVIETPSMSDLYLINKFVFVVYREENIPINCSITGIAYPQIVISNIFNISLYESINSITVTNTTSGSGVLKVALTTDGTTYKVYDTGLTDWKIVSDMSTDGMSISALNNLTKSQLELLLADTTTDTGIVEELGFKFLLDMTNLTDVVEISNISINVDFAGSYESCQNNIDYKYSYLKGGIISINLFSNGDYIINYPN